MVSREQLEKEYRGKKVFLTGHTGFKGAWLMACLQQAGAEVRGYALPPEQELGLFATLGPLKGVTSILETLFQKPSAICSVVFPVPPTQSLLELAGSREGLAPAVVPILFGLRH